MLERYSLGKEVGRGSYAQAFEVTDLRTGERLCAKKLSKFKHNMLPQQAAAAVAAEAETLRTLSAASPAVVRFREVAQDCSYFYLVTELCVSDLQRYLAEHPAPLHERQVACILRQLLTALAAVHRAGIAYRDVKPANLLVRGLDANGLPQLALADFGCCRSTAAAPPAARVSAGTPLFSAPECVHSAGGCEADLWSAGVLLYHLLSGRWPFCDPSVPISQGEYWRRVAEAPIHFAGPAWHHVSPGAVALCRRLLDRDCSRRISAEAALQDPWLRDMTSSSRAPASSAAPAAAPAAAAVCASSAASNVLPGLPGQHRERAAAKAAVSAAA